jgi:hypothetical protein
MLTTSTTSKSRMDALADGHFRGEEAGDVDAVVAGFIPQAEHDVAGRPGGPLYGQDAIGAFYRGLLAELRIDRFEPVRRWYGDSHLVDESVLHARAIGRPFGMEGRGRPVSVRMLHVFDYAEDRIARESAWLDVASLSQQLAPVA